MSHTPNTPKGQYSFTAILMFLYGYVLIKNYYCENMTQNSIDIVKQQNKLAEFYSLHFETKVI